MVLFIDQYRGILVIIGVVPVEGLILIFLLVDLVLRMNPIEVFAVTDVIMSDMVNDVVTDVTTIKRLHK
jgi:uncharacterized membrane protein